MHMSGTQWSFGIAQLALQLLLLAIMHVRKSRSEFPIFFNYIAFTAITQVFLLVALRGSYAQYFYSYWSVSAVGLLLGFGVLYESLVQVMKPFSALTDLAKMIFVWAGGFLLAVSLLTALATGGNPSDKICAAVLLLNRCIQLMQCGLFLILLLFEKRLGASWRNRGICIAAGLGMTAVVQLSMWSLLTRFPGARNQLDLAGDILSIGIVVFWSVGLVSSKSQKPSASNAPNRLVLQRWNDVLAGHGFGGVPAIASMADSFIPGVEQAVERVMSRKMVH